MKNNILSDALVSFAQVNDSFERFTCLSERIAYRVIFIDEELMNCIEDKLNMKQTIY